MRFCDKSTPSSHSTWNILRYFHLSMHLNWLNLFRLYFRTGTRWSTPSIPSKHEFNSFQNGLVLFLDRCLGCQGTVKSLNHLNRVTKMYLILNITTDLYLTNVHEFINAFNLILLITMMLWPRKVFFYKKNVIIVE